MGDSERQFAFNPAQDDIVPDEVNMVANDSESSYGERRDPSQVLTQGADVHGVSLTKVIHNLEQLHVSVKTVTADIENMKNDVLEIRKSSTLIQNSLSIIEIILCTRDQLRTKTTDGVVVPGSTSDGTPRTETEASQKRKMTDTDDDRGRGKSIVDVSDSEDEFNFLNQTQTFANLKMESPSVVGKPQLPSSWTQPHDGASKKNKTSQTLLSKTDFRRKVMAQQTSGGEVCGVAKCLFGTPSSGPMSTDVPGIYEQVIGAFIHGQSAHDTQRSSTIKPKFKLVEGRLPKGLKLKFRPTQDMGLESHEIHVCVYIFHYDQEPKEIIASAAGVQAIRTDFECLCPGQKITAKIMTLATEKLRFIQAKESKPTVWILPPSFAEDVFRGRTVYELIADYSTSWMPHYPLLKYIYVPVKTPDHHWYLVVVDVDEGVVFQMDSYLGADDIVPRTMRISMVAEALCQCAMSSHYAVSLAGKRLDFGRWPVREVRGIPNTGRSDCSGVWVVDWMNKLGKFEAVVIGELRENTVRMKTASDIANGGHNGEKVFIEHNARVFWDNLKSK